MAKNAIGMAIACEEYGAKFFANGATPGGILEDPGTVKDPQRGRDSWTSAFGGSSNFNKVAVLEEGMKYTPISISPEQAQFFGNKKISDKRDSSKQAKVRLVTRQKLERL